MQSASSSEDSVLISDDSTGRSRRVIVHGGGVRGKKAHAAKQIASGEGYAVDVADEAAFKHYVFVNAEEYGLFDQKRRFLQMLVCYQVLTTQWNSRSKRDPSSLKPRYLFLFNDLLFVMKLHDSTDTATRRYRILGRLPLRDLVVEEAGDDMFDVVARNTGALRFAVGSSVTKTQAVTALHRAIRQHRSRTRASEEPVSDVPVPTNPDDVFETMNYALAVLEKKLRGTATEEERWQADALLRHALQMQESQYGPLDMAALAEKRSRVALEASDSSASNAAASLRARLDAKERQLRATEDRAAAAEAAVARLRGGASAEDAEQRNLALENRKLRENLDRLRAQSEENERLLRAARQELDATRRASRIDASGDVAYHEGSVDQIISRIQQAPSVPLEQREASYASAARNDRAERDAVAEADRRAEERRRQQEAREEAERKAEEDARRRRHEEAAAEAERQLQQRRREEEDAAERQRLARLKDDEDRRQAERQRARQQEELDEQEEAKTRTPVAVISNVVAKKSSSSGTSSEALSDGSEELSTMSSDDDNFDDDDDAADKLLGWLREHDLGHIHGKLVDAGVELDRLRYMDVGFIRSLPGLDYAEASNLCTALGLQNIHQ